MELVLFEGSLVSLAILEVLSSFSIKHAVMPISLILAISTFSIQGSPSTLHPVSKLTFVPTSVTPPKGSSSIALASFELSFVNIAFLTCPIIYSSSFFLVEPKLSHIVISCGKIQFSLPLQLSIMEISRYYLMSILKVTNSLAVRAIDFCLSNISNLRIFEEFWIVESWLNSKYNWRAIFDSKKLLQLQLNNSQFSSNKSALIIQVIKVELRLFKHFLL